MKQLTGLPKMAYIALEPRNSPVDVLTLFRQLDLEPWDQVGLAKAFQLCSRLYKKEACWPVDRHPHIAFDGFNTGNKNVLTYRGVAAGVLLLGLSGRFQESDDLVATRISTCKSPQCFNPTHYYWGTKSQVAYETQLRNQKKLSIELIENLRNERQNGSSVLALSRKYKLAYHVARRICNGESYRNLGFDTQKNIVNDEVWYLSTEICNLIVSCYPEIAKELNLAVRVADHLTCPWHHKGSPKHKGNFGLMGECLDCMEEMKKGRCTVDVRQFDPDWYWQVKRFWEQVDVKAQDQCWPWLGSTRRQNKESLAYFPSPFHSGKIQSAPRVALWLSRGYTGKYRVFSRTECEPFCCNPLHLTIRELKGHPVPTEIEAIHLKHDNVFQHYRETHQQMHSGLANELSPS